MTPRPPAKQQFNPVISLLRPEQIAAAVELFGVQLKEHNIATDSNSVREVIEKIIADERLGFILVATVGDGKPVGVALGSAFLGVEHGGVSGWLEELYVRPAWRQRGLGARLVSEVIRQARARGWRALDLEVEAGHERVVSLYFRHGFQPRTRSRFFLKLD
jgi:GNAT superfamily N-acetyltransferase